MTSIVKCIESIKYVYVVTFLVALNSGCKKADLCNCLKGAGKEITEIRSVSPFYAIELNNKVDLHIHYDSVYRISVVAGENLIDNITTTIENGMLKIDNKNNCNWVRSFENKFSVNIYTPEIKSIKVENSSGNIYFKDTLSANLFNFESWSSTGDYFLKLNCGTVTLALQTGPASLYVEGKIGVGYYWNSGGGKFDALKLLADDIYMMNKGTNDAFAYSRILMEAIIEFSGNIYYKGNPPRQQLENKGSGKFIAL